MYNVGFIPLHVAIPLLKDGMIYPCALLKILKILKIVFAF